ncbi:hypothetical protein GQ472_06325 [archaeon]|nr:hypothetical protein [archaeon]
MVIVDAVDIPVVDAFYGDVSDAVEEIFRKSGLSEKYDISGFIIDFELRQKINVDSSKIELKHPIDEDTDFKESLFNFLRLYKLKFQYLQVDENQRQLLEDSLNYTVKVSDIFNADEFETVLRNNPLEKDYTGFYVYGGITGNNPVLIVYCHEPETVSVNAEMSKKITAEQILVEFF